MKTSDAKSALYAAENAIKDVEAALRAHGPHFGASTPELKDLYRQREDLHKKVALLRVKIQSQENQKTVAKSPVEAGGGFDESDDFDGDEEDLSAEEALVLSEASRLLEETADPRERDKIAFYQKAHREYLTEQASLEKGVPYVISAQKASDIIQATESRARAKARAKNKGESPAMLALVGFVFLALTATFFVKVLADFTVLPLIFVLVCVGMGRYAKGVKSIFASASAVLLALALVSHALLAWSGEGLIYNVAAALALSATATGTYAMLKRRSG